MEKRVKKNLLLCSLLLLMFLAMTETILTWAGSASTQFSKVRRCLRHLQHERGQACLCWEQQGRVDWLRPWWAWRESQASTGKAASPLPLTNPYLQSQTLWHKMLAKPYYGLCIIYKTTCLACALQFLCLCIDDNSITKIRISRWQIHNEDKNLKKTNKKKS